MQKGAFNHNATVIQASRGSIVSLVLYLEAALY